MRAIIEFLFLELLTISIVQFYKHQDNVLGLVIAITGSLALLNRLRETYHLHKRISCLEKSLNDMQVHAQFFQKQASVLEAALQDPSTCFKGKVFLATDAFRERLYSQSPECRPHT